MSERTSHPTRTPLPEGWEWKTLSELGTWTGGGTPSKRRPEFWREGNVPWVSPKDMKSWILDATQDHITQAAVTESAAKPFAANSIAFVVRSGILEHTLPVVLIPFEATANQDLKVLTPHEDLSPRWLLYTLLGVAEGVRRTCRKDGTTVASIEYPLLRQYAIPTPPHDEQEQMVEEAEALLARMAAGAREVSTAARGVAGYRLSVVEAAVTGRIRVGTPSALGADELLDEILRDRRSSWEAERLARFEEQSRIPTTDAWKAGYPEPLSPTPLAGVELPRGWAWATVDQLSTMVQYGSSVKASEVLADGVPVLRMGNIVEGRLDLSQLKYLPWDHPEFPELLLEDGDLLFNRTNSPELVGKAALYSGEPAPCSFASYLIRVRLADQVRPELLVYFLTSALGRTWVRSVVSQQVGQANVNGTKLKGLTVPPPRDGQDAICDLVEEHLSSARDSQAAVQAAMKSAAALRFAVIRQVTGPRSLVRLAQPPRQDRGQQVRQVTW